MNETLLMKKWQDEENFVFEGWDFSRIDGRWDCPAPPWNYRMILQAYLKSTDLLLDMGTGGGEILRSIGHPYNNTYATEAYVPNYELCKKILSPLGITVAQTFTDDKLPFDNGFFDFVINRHESFDLTEVNRVLKNNGYFITQQVGNQNSIELMENLNDGYTFHSKSHTINNYTHTLEQLGFRIILKDEVIYSVKFFDIGALIFYAKVCPWEFPDFSVKTHFKKLCEYQAEIDKKGYISASGHRFIIAAKK